MITNLDGTLADIKHRLHLLQKDEKDWLQFFKACVDDVPNQPVIDTIDAIAKSSLFPINVHIFSGRSEVVRPETVSWLERYVSFEYLLTMRPENDHRPDHVLKKSLAENLNLNTSNVLCVFDDRKSVVQMWHREGFCCYQVADHNF